ncbi:MAG: 50S ribosomal protein L18 [Deltaproteobacteria bacterium]|nr:50S ribosomal protein L18 [Deltaproteobacteria bacterium]
MLNADKKRSTYLKRKFRVRKKVVGIAERPRLNVYRSNKHIYAQVVDDAKGRTIASASSLSKEIRTLSVKGKINTAKKVGELAAKNAIAKGIDKVVFDRGGFLYHGRIKAAADGAREAGLKF